MHDALNSFLSYILEVFYMIKHLIKHEYPELKTKEINKAKAFIDGKCSEYYFIDYLRTTNGNIDDAIEFYLLDDKLRTIFTQYLIRFEIQLKTDFVDSLQQETHSGSFWSKKIFYIEEARYRGNNGKISKYLLIKRKIESNIARLSFKTKGPSNYVAMYSSSFGTFQELFKLIDLKYKQPFINKYTSHLNFHDYKDLNAYFEAIRRIRNRCAHGNHIITIKMVNDLNGLRSQIFKQGKNLYPCHFTVMEAVIFFMINQLNCGIEFKNKIEKLLVLHKELLEKYNGKHSLSGTTLSKIQLIF